LIFLSDMCIQVSLGSYRLWNRCLVLVFFTHSIWLNRSIG
jgi:hypothetical protein